MARCAESSSSSDIPGSQGARGLLFIRGARRVVSCLRQKSPPLVNSNRHLVSCAIVDRMMHDATGRQMMTSYKVSHRPPLLCVASRCLRNSFNYVPRLISRRTILLEKGQLAQNIVVTIVFPHLYPSSHSASSRMPISCLMMLVASMYWARYCRLVLPRTNLG
jgi:hypothetical protein